MDLFNRHLEFNKIIFRDKFYYPQEINNSIEKLSSYLKNNKESNSPFVYLFAHNHINTIIAYFAIIKSGKICVLVDPEIKHIELSEMMQDTPPFATIKFEKLGKELDLKNDIVFTDNNIDVDNKQLEDVCTMVYTNADDGFAKAAMLSKKNILSDAEAHATTNDSNKNSVMCSLLPYHHLYGMVIGVIAPSISNSTILIEDPANLLRIRSIADKFYKYHLTHLYSIPFIYYLLNKIPNIHEKLNNIKYLISGGYKLPLSTFNQFKQKYGIEILEGYGLTEASPVCTWHHPGKKVKQNSVGQPFNCCKIKISNEDNYKVPTGKIGEICIKGDNVMKGYYNNEKATKTILRDNWLHTGDFGKIDKDGYLYFTGLKKYMFNIGGKNVYPNEVKRLININKNVKNIHIFGKESEIQGNTFHSKIELKINNSEAQRSFKKWCIENISKYKIPHTIEFL